EEFRLVSFHHDSQHVAIQVHRCVGGGHQRFELLQPFLVVKEATTLGEMVTQMVIVQPQLIQENGSAISPETAAVQPNVEEPVISVLRFLGGSIQQEPTVGLITFQAYLGSEETDLIQTDNVHRRVAEGQKGQAVHKVEKFLRRIVPEDDPLPLIDKESGEGVIELFRVHTQQSCYQMQVTGYAANAASPLITDICSTIAWAFSILMVRDINILLWIATSA